MNSIKSILYITVLITSYNAFGMFGLNHSLVSTEATVPSTQSTLVNLKFAPQKKTPITKFPQLSNKEKAEKAKLINLGLQFVPPKNHDQYFQEMTDLYLKNLTKSDPIPRTTKKEFYKNNLLIRRHSQ